MKNGIASTAIRKVGIDTKYMWDFKSNERKPIQIVSIQRGQNLVRGGGKDQSRLFHDCKERERSDEAEQINQRHQRRTKRRKDTQRYQKRPNGTGMYREKRVLMRTRHDMMVWQNAPKA